MKIDSYKEGFKARQLHNLTLNDCPYAKHTADAKWWQIGWKDAEEFSLVYAIHN
jgi:ribosome modulation factor